MDGGVLSEMGDCGHDVRRGGQSVVYRWNRDTPVGTSRSSELTQVSP